MTRELKKEDAYDLIEGAHVLGTGGGGDIDLARKRINEIYTANNSFKIQDITEFQPADMICIIGMVGGGISLEDRKYVDGLTVSPDNVFLEAIKELEDHLGKSFSGFVATEIGPGNIIVPLYAGSLLDLVTVDGDMCGRSKPTISISTTNVAGISITPLAIASVYGDRIVLKEAISDQRAEYICRMVSRTCGGSIGVARCPMTASEASEAVVSGTISLAVRLGKEIRGAVNDNRDPLPIIGDVLGARLVLTGTVDEFTRTESGGFTSGKIIFKSSDRTLNIWYQNEYLLSWLDGERYVTCPDSLLVVNRLTGKGLTPWKDDFYEEDLEVAVFIRPSAPIWQTKRGLEIFGPQVFQPEWEYKSF